MTIKEGNRRYYIVSWMRFFGYQLWSNFEMVLITHEAEGWVSYQNHREITSKLITKETNPTNCYISRLSKPASQKMNNFCNQNRGLCINKTTTQGSSLRIHQSHHFSLHISLRTPQVTRETTFKLHRNLIITQLALFLNINIPPRRQITTVSVRNFNK